MPLKQKKQNKDHQEISLSGKNRIAFYLERMLLKAKHARQACLFLPSITNLARILDCTALDIHEAMSELVDRGHQFLMLGMDSPITVCVEAS